MGIFDSLEHTSRNTSCSLDARPIIKVPIIIGGTVMYPVTLRTIGEKSIENKCLQTFLTTAVTDITWRKRPVGGLMLKCVCFSTSIKSGPSGITVYPRCAVQNRETKLCKKKL